MRGLSKLPLSNSCFLIFAIMSLMYFNVAMPTSGTTLKLLVTSGLLFHPNYGLAVVDFLAAHLLIAHVVQTRSKFYVQAQRILRGLRRRRDISSSYNQTIDRGYRDNE
jgi:hypothetical protein